MSIKSKERVPLREVLDFRYCCLCTSCRVFVCVRWQIMYEGENSAGACICGKESSHGAVLRLSWVCSLPTLT